MEVPTDADLLVVGFTQAGLLQRLLAGNTKRRLVRNQSVPMLVVPRLAHGSQTPASPVEKYAGGSRAIPDGATAAS